MPNKKNITNSEAGQELILLLTNKTEKHQKQILGQYHSKALAFLSKQCGKNGGTVANCKAQILEHIKQLQKKPEKEKERLYDGESVPDSEDSFDNFPNPNNSNDEMADANQQSEESESEQEEEEEEEEEEGEEAEEPSKKKKKQKLKIVNAG